jgi:hypothetical protein
MYILEMRDAQNQTVSTEHAELSDAIGYVRNNANLTPDEFEEFLWQGVFQRSDRAIFCSQG